MTHFLILAALVVGGFLLGNLIAQVANWLETTKDKEGKAVSREFLGENVYSMVAETLYFTALFSVPMSGNISIFILVVGLLLYSLYGRFGAEKLKPGKPEDEVETKWFPGYP